MHDSIDSNGSLRNLIDDNDVNDHETAKALLELRTMTRGQSKDNKQLSKDNKQKVKKRQTKKREMGMNDMLMSLLVLKATEKANEELRKRKNAKRQAKIKRKSKKQEKAKGKGKAKANEKAEVYVKKM